MSQQFVRAPQTCGQRIQQFQRDTLVAFHKQQEIVAREFRETRVFGSRRRSRAALAIEHCHLAEKISRPEIGEINRLPLRVGDADPHLADVD